MDSILVDILLIRVNHLVIHQWATQCIRDIKDQMPPRGLCALMSQVDLLLVIRLEHWIHTFM